MKKYFLILTFLLSFNAFSGGGDQVGNGGDVLVCSGVESKPLMLDMHEAHTKGAVLDLGDRDLSYQEKVLYVLNKLKTISSTRANLYLSWFEKFPKEARFKRNANLTDVDDTGLATIPLDCNLKQIAVQANDQNSEIFKARYIIDLDLFEKMDEDNKAVLILHELVWREGIIAHQENSRRVRQFNVEILKVQKDLLAFATIGLTLNPKVFEYKNYRAYDVVYSNVRNNEGEVIVSLEAYSVIATWVNEDHYCKVDLRKSMDRLGINLNLSKNKIEYFYNVHECFRKKMGPYTILSQQGFQVGQDLTVIHSFYDLSIPEIKLKAKELSRNQQFKVYLDKEERLNFFSAIVFNETGGFINGGERFVLDKANLKVDVSQNFSKLIGKECYEFLGGKVCSHSKEIQGENIEISNKRQDGDFSFEMMFAKRKLVSNIKNFSFLRFKLSGKEINSFDTDGTNLTTGLSLTTPAGESVTFNLLSVYNPNSIRVIIVGDKPILFKENKKLFKKEKTYLQPATWYVLTYENGVIGVAL